MLCEASFTLGVDVLAVICDFEYLFYVFEIIFPTDWNSVSLLGYFIPSISQMLN